MEINDSEESINTFLNLLFERLDSEQQKVSILKEEFDLKLKSLKQACKSNAPIEISNRKKEFVYIFKQLLQLTCVDDAQSLYFHFVQELNSLVNKFKNEYQNEAKSFSSSNDHKFLFNESKGSIEIEKELIKIKTQIQIHRNMTSVYEKETCLKKLNAYIKNEISGEASINNNNIKSAMRLTTDVEFVINMMNQSVKNS